MTACGCSTPRPCSPLAASRPPSARRRRFGTRQSRRDPLQLRTRLRVGELPVELVVALDQLEDLVVHLRELVRQRLAVAVDGIDPAAEVAEPALPRQLRRQATTPRRPQRAPVRHPRDAATRRAAEAASVVIDQIAVDAELKRVRVQLVRAKERIPLDAALLQQPEEVPAHIGDRLALLVLPGVAAPPVAGQIEPERRANRAEQRMRLRVPVVLVAADRNQRVLLEL